MKYDDLVNILYQDNLNWVYSVITTLDKEKIDKKEKYIKNYWNGKMNVGGKKLY